MRKITALVAAVSLFAALPAQAAVETYEFDTAHTQIFFSVDHLGFSRSTGAFTDFSGGFAFDHEQVENSSVSVTIRTDSVDMDNEAWETHLKTPDFFHVEAHPEMTFKSTSVEKTGDNTGRVTGDLTLLGVTKPVTLDVTFNKRDIHPYSKKYVAGFSATGTLKRSDFGMTYGLPGVGDDVELRIAVEGVRTDADKDESGGAGAR